LRWILLQLAMIFIFLLVADTSREWKGVQRWEKVMIWAAIFFAGLAVMEMLSWYSSWWRITGNWFSMPPIAVRSNGIFFFHPNMFAAYLNLVIPLVLVRVIQADKWPRRILWLEGLLLLLVAEFFTASRGGWLGLAVAGAVTLGLYFLPGLKRPSLRIQLTGRARVGWVIAVLAIVLLIPVAINQVRSTPHGPLDYRVSIWQYGLDQVQDAPITGQGLGALPFLYTKRPEGYGVDEVFHAHNLVLQVAGDTGLVGLFLLLAAIVIFGRGFRSAWRNTEPGKLERGALAAYGGIFVGLLAHGLVDIPVRSMANGLALAILLGLVYHRAAASEFLAIPRKTAVIILAGILVIYALVTLVYRQGDIAAMKGTQAAVRGDWPLAAESLCRGAQSSPGATYLQFQCALADAQLAHLEGDSGALSAALEIQRRAWEVDPFWYIHQANLASYEWESGDRSAAIENMARAAETAPKNWLLWLNLAWMEDQAGLFSDARRDYQRAICLNPGLAESVLMGQTSFRVSVTTDGCPANTVAPPITLFSAALARGTEAMRNGDFSKAELGIEEALAIQPTNSLPYAYLALVRQASGQQELAERDLQLSFFLSRGSVDTLLLAAEFARRQGNTPREMELLQQAYQALANPDFSWWYYQPAYSRKSLPVNLSPYLITAPITNDQREQLLRWVDALDKQGDSDTAGQVRRWIDENTSR
jgi:O-antigen ligase